MNLYIPVRVALYMRYSSNAQNDGFSIEAQEKALRKYCKDKGFEIVRIYVDRACTGTNDRRESFQKMIDEAKLGIFDLVLIHKFDRFARNREDSIRYKNELLDYGIKVISITEYFGEGAEGELMEGFQEAIAEYYSKNLAREVRKGMDIVASKGLHTGGIPPLGYYVGDDRKLHIDENEVNIVRCIFEMYSKGYTYNSIAKELNLRGYKTKIGKEFSSASLNTILHNRKYIGEYVYNRRVQKNRKGKCNSHKEKSEDEIIRIPNGVPRIVDDETFNKVQKRLEANKRKITTYKPNSSYLLSGLVECGVCGFRYQGNSRTSGGKNNSIYSSYRCGKKQNHKGGCSNKEIEKNRLENFVLEQLQKYLFTDEAISHIKDLVNKYNKDIASLKSDDVVRYKQELTSVNKQLKNLTNAIALGVYEETFVEKINALQATKKELKIRLAESSNKKPLEVSDEQIRRALSNFKEYVKENNTVEIKAFLNTYIDKIIVNPDDVEVIFKIASNDDEHNENLSKLLVDIDVSRENLKQQPKQKRKFNSEAVIESNSVKYDIAG